MKDYSKQLEARIESLAGKPVNVTQVFEYYTFDVMGDMSFSVKFNMLKEGRVDPSVQLFKNGMALMDPLTPVPWIFHTAVSIPGFQRDWRNLKSWANQTLRTRLNVSV